VRRREAAVIFFEDTVDEPFLLPKREPVTVFLAYGGCGRFLKLFLKSGPWNTEIFCARAN
jgi:hypothetical protein